MTEWRSRSYLAVYVGGHGFDSQHLENVCVMSMGLDCDVYNVKKTIASSVKILSTGVKIIIFCHSFLQPTGDFFYAFVTFSVPIILLYIVVL